MCFLRVCNLWVFVLPFPTRRDLTLLWYSGGGDWSRYSTRPGQEYVGLVGNGGGVVCLSVYLSLSYFLSLTFYSLSIFSVFVLFFSCLFLNNHLITLSIYKFLFIYMLIYLYLSSNFVFINLFIQFSICLINLLRYYPPIDLSNHMYVSLFIMSVHQRLSVYQYLSIYLSINPFVYLFDGTVWLSIYLSIYLFYLWI